MSWDDTISAELLLQTINISHKELENPKVTIPVELLTDCLIKYTIDDYGVTAVKDHPCFTELRQMLSNRGFIKIPDYPCVNGDIVLNKFIFNELQLKEGDRFYSAGAWKVKFESMKDIE